MDAANGVTIHTLPAAVNADRRTGPTATLVRPFGSFGGNGKLETLTYAVVESPSPARAKEEMSANEKPAIAAAPQLNAHA